MTTNRTPKPRFVLHLEATPRPNDPSGMGRLRAILKVLLRGFSMRCTSIQYPDLETPPTTEGTSNDQ